jgi:hypothetical protein
LWIAQAQIIDGNGNQMPVREIIQKSLRLDCILPCIDGPHADPGPAGKGFIIQSGLRSYQDCVSTIEADALLRKDFEGAAISVCMFMPGCMTLPVIGELNSGA